MKEGATEACVRSRRRPLLLESPPLCRCCSTIIEPMSGSASRGFSERLWPFDMGGGMPINCTTYPMFTQLCSPDQSLPGLWQVPGRPMLPAQRCTCRVAARLTLLAWSLLQSGT